MIEFFAPGLPRSQGSKRHVGRGIMIEQTEVKEWRGVVAVAASNAMRGTPLLADACKAVLVFRFPRPAGHFKPTGELRASAPWWPASSRGGDIDKLQRAVFDALTGVVYVDDKLVCRVLADRLYATPTSPPGALVRISTFAPDERPPT